MTAQALLSALADDPMERLRWRVCRTFGLSPDAPPSDGACLWAAANLVLDGKSRKETEKAGANPAFDEGRFRCLREVTDGAV